MYSLVLRHPLNGARPLILQRISKNFLFSLPGEAEKDTITIVTPQLKNNPKRFNIVLKDTNHDSDGSTGTGSNNRNNKYPSVQFQVLCEQTLLLKFIITFGSEFDPVR